MILACFLLKRTMLLIQIRIYPHPCERFKTKKQ